MADQTPEDFAAQLNKQLKHERFVENSKMGHDAKEAIDPTDGDHRGLGKHKAK